MRYEVILDSGETANKCTIAPLADRTDFTLFKVGKDVLGPLRSLILLHHEGECITVIRARSQNAVEGIAAIDCVWRRLNPLISRIEGPLPERARIPEGFVTAYPRRSRKDSDPAPGLATIEAIFTAAALLGNWDPTLLAQYHFGRTYIELNTSRFLELGVPESSLACALPVQAPRVRNALQRRKDRGKRRPWALRDSRR